MILDIASGTGSGIKYIIQRINWNCTVILTDLSHRILSWNHKYFFENLNNPYVDLVYLVYDCANLPIQSHVIDCVTSRVGFESMQMKMEQGFSEEYRVLKVGANAIFDKSLVDDHHSANTKKWIKLLMSLDGSYNIEKEKLFDLSQ